MESQKLEDLLLLSLNSTEEERMESENLITGYDVESGKWELIIKYHGLLDEIMMEGVIVEPLINGYAIITIPENMISEYIKKEQIEYVEMPKKIYEESYDGRRDSCVFEITRQEPYLSGKGVLIGIIDSGIDIYHNEFLDEDGNTRILGIWDQSQRPNGELLPPEGFQTGVYYDEAKINNLVKERLEYGENVVGQFPGNDYRISDLSGHGTAVASIAAGSNIGMARESKLLVVKLGYPLSNTYPRTTQLMRAVHFMTSMASRLGMPIAINISFGNSYGDHQGTSLLERYLDNESEIGRNVICVGSGNEANSSGHYQGKIHEREFQNVEFSVDNYETNLSIQLWKNYQDEYKVSIISPEGEQITFEPEMQGLQRSLIGNSLILAYLGQPSPYSVQQEFYFDFQPLNSYITSGVWKIRVEAITVKNGNYNLYLPSYAVRSEGTGFYNSSPNGTFTIPSTSERVITVGAYNSGFRTYANFSGRGFMENSQTGIILGNSKPDLVAPGVNVLGAEAGGGYGEFTGTSFATPYVTGGAALLMEWGIVRKNDPYLYGQKCKSYFIKGAKKLVGDVQMPNARSGWGALCMRDSI